jgi:A/G-specific adenine glycosylase
MPFIEKALAHPKNKKNPREWHYALMDYGSHLKKSLPNPSRRSAHHMKQTPFKGSNRELRSRILKLAMEKGKQFKTPDILTYFNRENISQEKVQKNIDDLKKEGFLSEKKGSYLVIVS